MKKLKIQIVRKKNKLTFLIGSALIFFSVILSFYFTAVGIRINLYKNVAILIFANIIIVYSFLAFCFSKKMPKIEKKVFCLWVIWLLLLEAIGFSPYIIALSLHGVGLFIVGFSLYYTKIVLSGDKDNI